MATQSISLEYRDGDSLVLPERAAAFEQEMTDRRSREAATRFLAGVL